MTAVNLGNLRRISTYVTLPNLEQCKKRRDSPYPSPPLDKTQQDGRRKEKDNK